MKIDLLTERLCNQKLTRSDYRSAADVVRWLGAVQAQDYSGAKWALGQRATGVTDADVERAFDAGAILRTHVLRPTWHFVTPAAIRWMLALTAPRVRALMAYYDRKLELTPAIFARSHAVLERALRGGKHLTRAELASALARSRIVAHGQRLGHLVMRAELDALVCSGPRRGKQFTYALLEERVPSAKPLTRDEALAELTLRYFTSHGPATVRDYVWWSGLTARDAMRAIEMLGPALVSRELDGLTYWLVPVAAATRVKPRSVYLLPNYDEYGIAYKARGVILDGARPSSGAGATEFPHLLIVNGKWTGSWKRTLSAKAASVELRPARPLTRDEMREVGTAAARYSRFLGLPVTLSPA